MGYGIPVRDGVGAGAAGKFFRRRRRRHLGVDPKNIGFCIKNIEYQILREWTLEQPSRRDTINTWKLITTALRVFLVFTTWGDRPEIRDWSPNNIRHYIFSRCIFSNILLKNMQTHLLDLIYYI